MTKYNVISHITTYCNYNCNYCDVIKDNRSMNRESIDRIIKFINENYKLINRFKFFGGEPLLNFNALKKIIDSTHQYGLKYEIVTNTSLLNDKVGKYFEKYFYIIFFSIDSQNNFNYDEVLNFINKYNLKYKLYFNLIISPGKHNIAKEQFIKLYNLGFRNFNILPVYYKLPWSKTDLNEFSKLMKYILDLSINDNSIKLYGFQDNLGYNNSLLNKSIFIDVDLKIYYTDFVSTKLGMKLKEKLFLGNLDNYKLNINNNFTNHQKLLNEYEFEITQIILGQKQLHKIMDYFSKYLNNKKINKLIY